MTIEVTKKESWSTGHKEETTKYDLNHDEEVELLLLIEAYVNEHEELRHIADQLFRETYPGAREEP